METKALAQFAVNLTYHEIGKETLDMVKLCVLDWFACCIRGSEEKPAKILQEVLAEEHSAERQSTVFGTRPYRTSALFAALSNGLYSHALDMDDVHKASYTHLGVGVIPAAIAAAEKVGASGKELIAAIVAGYEIMARVAESVLPDSYTYWHLTSTAGTFGAAVAAGKLLGLNEQQMIYAMGSAGTQAAGLFEFLRDGANSKTLHAGKANFNGLLSAMLSLKGFTAAEKILEGEKGFCNAMTPTPRIEMLTKGLGEGCKIDTNSFKPYACCRWVHAAIGGALELKTKHSIKPEQIKRILLKVHPTAIEVTDNSDPRTIYGCKFSLQYCVAVALLHDRAGIDQFTNGLMNDKDVRAIMALVTTQAETATGPDGNPNVNFTEVVFVMRDGATHSMVVPYPLGDPENPMSFAAMEEKFRSLVEPVYNEEKIQRILQLCNDLEKQDNLGDELAFLTNQ
ncbi:MmgE/PrpD family protein [Desulfitobacterium hafniense]|uniref:MmgE/PrpD family protein n=1 Tax=Desulfitobacterium hafniense TaxID=49338 RepID=UPI000477A30B|nr:MmgE/PrpD family protein [Desulfitobacterium hafniense]